MERNRVEDLKNKFECLQSQSAVKTSVNKPALNHKKLCNNNSLTIVSNTSKSNGDSLNVRLPSSSNFVGRGNIKRSHAFRADKPISRNYSNFGNDLPLSSDPTRENVFCDSQEIRLSSVKGSPELKTDGILFDSRFKKQTAREKDGNIKCNNLPNNSVLSNNQKCHLDNISSSSNYPIKSFDKHKDEIKVGEGVRAFPIPKDTYSTVVKSCKNLPVSSLSINDNVNLCDTSANFKNINVDSDYKSKNSETNLKVKSIVKSVEQKNIKKSSTEKIKPAKLSHKHKPTNDIVISNDNLSNTLKAALSAPLPIGPPPKKPPRTFAHNLSIPCDESPLKKQNVLKTNSSSGLKQTCDTSLVVTNKPVRSKTESQIMLKKLENYLLNHQQNSGSVNSGSLMKDKSCNSNEMSDENKHLKLEKQQLVSLGESKSKEMLKIDVKSNTEKFSSRSTVSHRKLSSNNNNINSSNCFNSLNCTRQPIYASPTEKQSNFFVTIPKRSSVESIDNDVIDKPTVEFRSSSYGTIKRSASVEHIYAEPETTEIDILSSNNKTNSIKFKCATISERRGRSAGMCTRPLLSPLVNNFDSSRSTVQLLKTNFESPAGSKELKDQESGALQYGLHYMCTPISDTSCSNNSSKKENINSGLFTSHLNSAGDFLNEAINKNVRLNAPSFSLTSNCNSNNTTAEKCDNADRLLSLSLVSDCTQPRRVRAFSSSSEVPVEEIDKQRIHQLLSEAYGKIKHNNNSNIMSSGRKASSSGDIASGSDSDCSSVISSPDDPNLTFLSQPSSSSVISAVATSGAMSVRSTKDREQITAERKGYVRRVSRRLTSIRQSANVNPDRFSHLFECLILVGLDLNSAHCKVPYIKSKFPENISSPPGIESLCFPDADDWPPEPDSGQSYIQILTDSNGIRKYSYCRRVQPEDAAICLPLVYCIITPYKSNSFYDKVLVDLESRHGHQSDGDLSAFIHQLYNCHFPAPGQTFSIRQHSNSSDSSIIDVYKRPLDPREEDNELAKLLTIIKLSIFLQIFATLLHERKVILVSDSISKLSICIEGLQSALYPFNWQHTLVPILPSTLMDVCEAPTPYLIGIIKPKLSDLPLNNIDLDLVVDIDKDTILNSKGDEGWILPTRLSRGLRSALQLSIQESQSNINAANILASEAIMRLFVEMIGHYRDHILVASDTRKREFQRDSFVRNGASRSIQLFLEWFTETAMFNAFIESRLERTSESRGMFEQRCSEYIEENEMSHPLMKKAINKTVKSLGDRFKDWAALS